MRTCGELCLVVGERCHPGCLLSILVAPSLSKQVLRVRDKDSVKDECVKAGGGGGRSIVTDPIHQGRRADARDVHAHVRAALPPCRTLGRGSAAFGQLVGSAAFAGHLNSDFLPVG